MGYSGKPPVPVRCVYPWYYCGSTACWIHGCSLDYKEAKRVKGQEREPLVTDNLAAVERVTKAGTKLEPYYGLVAILADVVDTAARGDECYLTFGLSRNRDQIMLTVHIGRDALYASGASLVEVSKVCIGLL